ncbi:MAG TPA: 4-oxalocrotonate decarboxylase [Thermodesulfobacteriota bacterium]|nr:4-oxalocrotonate decarboxylase [Thermodesulfobacteriota bacterium]
MIRKGISLCLGFVLLAFITTVAWAASVSEMADFLLNARRQNKPIPILSSRYPELDIETAYQVQRMYVIKRLANDNIAVFKAGLTGEESQKKFGVDFPVAGVLFISGKKMSNSTINKSEFQMPMIETEIGFVVGKPITRPVRSASAFYENIKAVVPVIELPELGFEDMKRLKVEDIIASNVGAAQFIVGEEKKLNGLNLNNVTVTLSLDGQVVNRGKGEDALGDQVNAALWLIDKMVNEAWRIEPGHILITGVLGKMIPAERGKYVADYGSLGKISFEIK